MSSYVLANKYKNTYWNHRNQMFGPIEQATIYQDKASAESTVQSYLQEGYDPQKNNTYEDQTLTSAKIEQLTNVGRYSIRIAQHVEPRVVMIIEEAGKYILGMGKSQYAALCKVFNEYEGDDPALNQIIKSIVIEIKQNKQFPSEEAIAQWKEMNQECWVCEEWFLKTELIKTEIGNRHLHICAGCSEKKELAEYVDISNKRQVHV